MNKSTTLHGLRTTSKICIWFILFSGTLLSSQKKPPVVPVRNIDLQHLNKEYRNSVVKIEFTTVINLRETKLNPEKSERYSGRDDEGSHGTGFFINDEEILTNAHVVENARRGSIRIKSPATGNLKFKVEVIGIGSMNTIDLALLRFPKDEQMRFKKRSGLNKISHLKFGDSNKLKQSDHLAILGYPKSSDEIKVIEAEVTGRQYQHFNSQNFFINHQFIEVGPGGVIQRGNSGGPALDINGTVVGIPTLGDYQGNQGWLIPIDIVKMFLDRIRNNQTGKIPLNIPELGVELLRNFPGTLVRAGAPEDITLFELGVVIREVFPQSTAEKWGLKSGDILVGFANKQKGISCALDFEGYRVVTGNMAKWPQGKGTVSNLNKPKFHLKELMFTSNIGDEVTLWYLRPPDNGSPAAIIKLQQITNKIEKDSQNLLPNIGLYEKPEYEYWGDFIAQDFNEYNTKSFGVPITEVLKGGVLVTYVEPNSLASHRGLEISNLYSPRYFAAMYGMGGTGGQKWYIIEFVNGKPVKNLKSLKKALRTAEKQFEDKKKSREYKQEKKNLYRERYAQVGIRTNSLEGKIVRFNATFPIDDALECCRK
jgi:S1-C subfamily serine protease